MTAMRIVVPAGIAIALLAATEAAAFDCAKAATQVEKAICASPQARDANEALESGFAVLRGNLPEQARKILVEGQRAWLKYRDARCGPVAACLAEESLKRSDRFAATPAGMAPQFLFKAGVPGGYEVVLDMIRFAGDGVEGAAFNSVIDRLILDSPLNDAPDAADQHSPYSHEISVSVERHSRRLVSAVATTYDFSGGAHPNSSAEAINIDRETGSPLSAPAVFGRAGVAALAEECALQIVGQREQYAGMDEEAALQGLEEEYPGVVHAHASDMRRWHFRADGAVLTFDAYAIGPYAAGPFECVFDWEKMRATARDAQLFDD